MANFFPPEVFEDVRGFGRRLLPWRRGPTPNPAGSGLGWLWLLLLLFPFSDYVSSALADEGVPEPFASLVFVALDVAMIVGVLLARRDAAGARFFGLLILALDLSYAATQIWSEGTVVGQLVYDVLYTVFLWWVLAHIFRSEPLGRVLTAPIVIGAFAGYIAFTLPSIIGDHELVDLLNSDAGVTYYNAAASVIPVFLIALSLEGGWLTDVEGDSPVASTLRHGLRLVTILVLAIAQAAAIGAMLAGGGSVLAYQITVEAMALGFTAIFIMLHLESRHTTPAP